MATISCIARPLIVARKPRAYQVVGNAPHHVWLRGNNRRRLFSYAYDYASFLDLLSDAMHRTRASLHGFALLANHAHLVLTAADAPSLSLCLKLTCQRYAQRRNKRRGNSGKLFEERFGCKPATSEAQLAAVLAYVDLNPVRAGLVEDPEHYPWSTAWMHLAAPEPLHSLDRFRQTWTPHSWYTSLAPDASRRAERYRSWLRDRASCGSSPPHDPRLVDRERCERRPNGTVVT